MSLLRPSDSQLRRENSLSGDIETYILRRGCVGGGFRVAETDLGGVRVFVERQ